jgi:A/G-specific adenine glycosylase
MSAKVNTMAIQSVTGSLLVLAALASQSFVSSYFVSTLFTRPTLRLSSISMKQVKRSRRTKVSAQQEPVNLPLDDSSGVVLESWLHHSSTDFHNFSSHEATSIRTSLLDWYWQYRRKLPWRGDDPPWQGSTVDFSFRNGKNQAPNYTPKTITSIHISGASFPITAYGVWVSEIMLQQTRVEAVIPYWVKWMKQFPDVSALASATEEQVNSHWAGLGFYRRARFLHQAAKEIVTNAKYDGQLPDTVDGLLQLPGIGRYTACAIASIAHNVTVPVVDGNVCRVLSRLRGIAQHVKAPTFKDQHAWSLAASIVEAGDGMHAGDVNQALMELGATYCAPAGTGTDKGDPLKDFYWSTRIGREAAMSGNVRLGEWLQQAKTRASGLSTLTTKSLSKQNYCRVCGPSGVAVALEALIAAFEETNGKLDELAASKCGHSVLPISPPKTAKREEVLAVAAISCQDVNGEVAWLLVRRPESGLLAGQWEFPSCCVWTSETGDGNKGGDVASTKLKDMSDKAPVISASARCSALNRLLKELESDEHPVGGICRRQIGSAPIEHVFSHVRHTMWIEAGSCGVSKLDLGAYLYTKGRRIRWMRVADMQDVGITSGVKKILKTVQKHQANFEPHSESRKAYKRRKLTT